MLPSEDPILTIPEVAQYLKMSRSKIYNLVARNEIPYLKVGRNVRILRKDLQKWVEKQSHQLNLDGYSEY
jgi:excisionase family DNA binding protein